MLKKTTMAAVPFLVLASLSMIASVALADEQQPVASNNSEVPVAYNNESGIVVGEDYVITVPSAIVFNSSNPTASVDATVDMKTLNGDPYTAGQGKADVSVASANGLKLKHSKGQEISYSLQYSMGGVLKQKTDAQAIGSYSSSKNSNKGVAMLGNDKANYKGNYQDVLTYTITDTTSK